jgi:hypothetical protein
MRSEWQAQKEIRVGRINDAAERCRAVRDRVNAARDRAARVEATAITIIAALVVGAAAYFFI